MLVYFITFVFLFFYKMEAGPSAIGFEKSLSKLEYNSNTFLKHLNQLLNSVNFNKFKSNTSGLEYAKFCSTMAFVLCSLHYIKLKLEGGNVGSHPVSNNLNRIKCYMKQINDKQTQGKRVNKVRINKEAVKRIINSSR
ncbi:Sas10/Utp3/C1D family protein [Theileria parva strain Muguga]|uniref:Sas10/Utp3/C1D family protein n=1 Tax=Theileria parva strain Muguga TaxID=333668 RepID=UPI001C61D24A|nr:Sas10/Utp3/C1D family protein [Theileria parva strain Muguga]KAF5153348.1 Sas10/Utp3/C1D family protein [Theileria parva strain Muguga]